MTKQQALRIVALQARAHELAPHTFKAAPPERHIPLYGRDRVTGADNLVRLELGPEVARQVWLLTRVTSGRWFAQADFGGCLHTLSGRSGAGWVHLRDAVSAVISER